MAAGFAPWSVAVGQLDGDNGLDIVVANDSLDDVERVLLHTGKNYAAYVSYEVASIPRVIAVGDLDGINGPDLVVTNFVGDDVSVLLNQGGGHFVLDGTYGVGNAPRTVPMRAEPGDPPGSGSTS